MVSDGRYHFLKQGGKISGIYMHNYSVCLRKIHEGVTCHHEAHFWLNLALELKDKLAHTTAEMIKDGTMKDLDRNKIRSSDHLQDNNKQELIKAQEMDMQEGEEKGEPKTCPQ